MSKKKPINAFTILFPCIVISNSEAEYNAADQSVMDEAVAKNLHDLLAEKFRTEGVFVVSVLTLYQHEDAVSDEKMDSIAAYLIDYYKLEILSNQNRLGSRGMFLYGDGSRQGFFKPSEALPFPKGSSNDSSVTTIRFIPLVLIGRENKLLNLIDSFFDGDDSGDQEWIDKIEAAVNSAFDSTDTIVSLPIQAIEEEVDEFSQGVVETVLESAKNDKGRNAVVMEKDGWAYAINPNEN